MVINSEKFDRFVKAYLEEAGYQFFHIEGTTYDAVDNCVIARIYDSWNGGTKSVEIPMICMFVFMVEQGG
jgi:hypothetical protein